MAEYGNKYVSTAEPVEPGDLPGCCGPRFRENHLGGPYEIYETSDGLNLNGQVLMIEPWGRMYNGGNYNGGNYNGASVMMDWRNNTVMVDEKYAGPMILTKK